MESLTVWNPYGIANVPLVDRGVDLIPLAIIHCEFAGNSSPRGISFRDRGSYTQLVDARDLFNSDQYRGAPVP